MEESTWLEAILEHLIFFGILFLFVWVVQKIANFSINQYFDAMYNRAGHKKSQADKKRYNTLANASKKIVTILLASLVFLAALKHFGVDTAFLLSGAGALGIFLGIAGKDILMDLYTGAMVLVEDQYRLGDVIIIDDHHSGAVEDITLRTVVLRDIDGNVHIVPHSQAMSVINMTPDFSRVKLDVGVAYDSDLDKVKKVINDVGEELANDTDWKADFIKPIAFDRTLSFDESAVTVRALGDVQAGRQWAVSGEFNDRLKAAFDKNDIEIPFPQRVMHMAPERKASKK
jgi:moderate conductance mechanosensitive channel